MAYRRTFHYWSEGRFMQLERELREKRESSSNEAKPAASTEAPSVIIRRKGQK